MRRDVLAFFICLTCAVTANAQTPPRCPDHSSVSTADRISSELQRSAFNAYRQAGQIAGDDPWYDLTISALREAAIHTSYLTSLYLVFPDIREDAVRKYFSLVMIPSIGAEITSALSQVDAMATRIRNSEARALLQRSVEIRRSIGRDFERCRLS